MLVKSIGTMLRLFFQCANKDPNVWLDVTRPPQTDLIMSLTNLKFYELRQKKMAELKHSTNFEKIKFYTLKILQLGALSEQRA